MSPQPELKFTPFLSLLKKELRRFTRVIMQTIFIPLINSTLYLLIFGVSLGNSIKVSAHFSYLAFLIPGLVMMGVLNNAFQNTSSSIGTSKFHGDLEDLKIVPIAPWQIVWALSLGGMIRGILVGLVTFSMGEVFFRVTQGEFLGVEHPFILLLFLVLGGLSFSFVGISCAFWAKNIEQLSAIGGFVLLPLMYLGGVFFPLENLHPFWRGISQCNPMLYFINGVRYGILGISDIPWLHSTLFSMTTLVCLFFLSVRTVKFGKYQRW